jgi:hypothetical protein
MILECQKTWTCSNFLIGEKGKLGVEVGRDLSQVTLRLLFEHSHVQAGKWGIQGMLRNTHSESLDSKWQVIWVGKCIFCVAPLPSSLRKQSLMKSVVAKGWQPGPVRCYSHGERTMASDLQHGCALT